jgi:hypothetical protein
MNETDMSDWDRLPNGEIETSPVAGWEVGAFPMNVMLRLEILMEDGRIGTAQLHMPADQAIGLAEALRVKGQRALEAGTSPPT